MEKSVKAGKVRKLLYVVLKRSYLWNLEEHIGWKEGGGIFKSSYGGQATKGWDHFLWGELTPRDTK